MTLKSFLKGRKEGTKIRIVYPTKIDDTQIDLDYKVNEKPHLFDVVGWSLELEKEEPIMVIRVR
jgi:hypothetical protein